MILFLSDVAGSEILLILLFVLMFFGSKSIPGLARTLGRTMRQIKDASQDLQHEIKKSGVDIKNDLNLGRILEETAEDIQQPLRDQVREMNSAVNFEPPTVFEMPENPLSPELGLSTGNTVSPEEPLSEEIPPTEIQPEEEVKKASV